MTDVELRHLATLTAVVGAGSFGRAASRLGYTQSTVSQHVAALERAVGGRLFDRPGGPRRVRLTPLGEVVLTHAERLLTGVETMRTAVERFRAGEGRLTIGTFQSVSNTLLPVLVRVLREEFPGCDIRLFEDEPDSPDLSAADLLFRDHRVAGADVEHLELLDDPYLLVCPRGRFPGAPGEPVDLARLDGEPMVAWPPDCAQPALDAALAAAGVHPDIVFRAAGNETVLSMVRAGLGSVVLPWLVVHAAGAAADEALSVHALRPPPAPRKIYLVRRAHRTLSPLAARAARLAAEIAGDLGIRGGPEGVRARTAR
ncbi:LysR family transcriptional regulator [Streptosporangium sp. DT93]|uniref:LysR family transcriptional regulator n=1 Tax=Streptosporangium sp. DT93 TaxID=3393428 RepID=UPI003CFAB4F2